MKSLKLFLLFGISILLFNAIELTSAKNWAVIIVGLDYYRYSYAYEAMAYKQYNELLRNGIPKENIIVISPNSAAFHIRNPMAGIVVYGYEGGDFSSDSPVNQYENVTVDYKNTEKFKLLHLFQILSGQANSNLTALGNGKVVKSGPNDNIFLYIHTVGREGLFLLNNRNYFFTDTFIPFIEQLAEAKAFKKLFIFFHSSDAGSLFDNYLDNNLNIMAYSLGGRYNDFRMCHPNKYVQAYTSSCQGYEHMMYMDRAISKNGAKETVLDMYAGSGLTSVNEEVVHNLYGDFRVARSHIKEFFGEKMKASQPMTISEIMELKEEVRKQTKDGKSIIKMLTEENPPAKEKDRIENSMNQVITESIKNTKISIKEIYDPVKHLPSKKYDCYRNAIETIRSKCLTKESEFVFLKYAPQFAQLCSMNVSQDKIISAIKSAC